VVNEVAVNEVIEKQEIKKEIKKVKVKVKDEELINKIFIFVIIDILLQNYLWKI
jgi:hypothetical protein